MTHQDTSATTPKQSLADFVHDVAVEWGNTSERLTSIQFFGFELRRRLGKARDELAIAIPASPSIVVAIYSHHGSEGVTDRFASVEQSFRLSEPPEEVLAVLKALTADDVDVAIRARASEFLFVKSSGKQRFEAGQRAVRWLLESADRAIPDEFIDGFEAARRAMNTALSMNSEQLTRDVYDRASAWLVQTSESELSLECVVETARLVSLSPVTKRTVRWGVKELRKLCADSLEAELVRGAYEQADETNQWVEHALSELEALTLDKEERRAVRLRRAALKERFASSRDSAMARSFVLMGLVEFLKETNSLYGATEQTTAWIERVEQEVVESSKDSRSEMKGFSHTVELKTEDIERAIEQTLEPEDAVGRLQELLSSCFVPKTSDFEAQVDEALSGTVFWRLASQLNVGSDGRPAGVVSGEQEQFQFQVNKQLQIHTQLRLDTLFAPALRRMLLEGVPSLQVIAEIFFQFHATTEQQASILATGLAYWRDGHDLVSLHLLVPQVEAGIRALMESRGHKIVKSKAGGVYHFETLDALIERAVEKEVLGDMHGRILRLQLTGALQQGPNIRNEVCHGLVGEPAAAGPLADIVVYCLFILLHAAILSQQQEVGGKDDSDSGAE